MLSAQPDTQTLYPIPIIFFANAITSYGIWQDQRPHSSNRLDVVTQKPQVAGENFNETVIAALRQILLRSKKGRPSHHWVTGGMLPATSVAKLKQQINNP